MFCCCVWELFINLMFFFQFPLFFSFSFIFRVVTLPSIVLLSEDMRMWLRCCWKPVLTLKPEIMLVGYMCKYVPQVVLVFVLSFFDKKISFFFFYFLFVQKEKRYSQTFYFLFLFLLFLMMANDFFFLEWQKSRRIFPQFILG